MITGESYCCNWDPAITLYYFELKVISILYNLTPLTVLSPGLECFSSCLSLPPLPYPSPWKAFLKAQLHIWYTGNRLNIVHRWASFHCPEVSLKHDRQVLESLAPIAFLKLTLLQNLRIFRQRCLRSFPTVLFRLEQALGEESSKQGPLRLSGQAQCRLHTGSLCSCQSLRVRIFKPQTIITWFQFKMSLKLFNSVSNQDFSYSIWL